MTAIAKAISRARNATQSEIETLKAIAIFCGAGLVASLLLALYGLDLTAGL
jgi:tRNA A37 threonylcarbamoyltransferase TsaD